MSASKHTPGPWAVDDNDIRDSAGDLIACAYYVAAEIHAPDPYETARVNARLIAAAPELLEALKRVVKWDTDHPVSYVEFEEIRKQADAAIAKAEGRNA